MELFKFDPLNTFVAFAILIFTFLIGIYSLSFMKGKERLKEYYLWIALSGLAAIGVVLANNLILLLTLWGFLGLCLFVLVNFGDERSAAAAKKALIIVGGTDALLLLGIGIIYALSGTFNIYAIRLDVSNGLAAFAFFCIAISSFAKAGLMPFHSWIPDCAEAAPVPVTAFLPASLDKLLGIYLLSRACLNLFILNSAINATLMLLGAFTIIAAVMMALVQHDMKRLLGYHAVSQVGYMVLGIGTATPIGIAGGIFHMLNNAIYKSCLFLTAGNVEYRAKTTELDKLGGLAKFMPLTYISCLVASLSISGVPPFNGFASKWMIYQGLTSGLSGANTWLKGVSALCLLIAMFGSGLTLASFMKVIHAVFLGQNAKTDKKNPIREAPPGMVFACVILAAFCVLFGVFAFSLPIKYFIAPIFGSINFSGSWYSGLATLLIIIALLLGWLCSRMFGLKPGRQDAMFIGGESVNLEENRVSGTEFYNTVKEYGRLPQVYAKAQAGSFDIYEQAKKFIFFLGRPLRFLHNGVMPTYLVWCLLGLLGLILYLVR